LAYPSENQLGATGTRGLFGFQYAGVFADSAAITYVKVSSQHQVNASVLRLPSCCRTTAISRSQPKDYPHLRTLSRFCCIAWFGLVNIEMGHVNHRFSVGRPALVQVVRGGLADHGVGERIPRRIEVEHLETVSWRQEGREHDAMARWMPCNVSVDLLSNAE
jgi:hypothetical protein